jgi:hypothetical protein
VPAQNAPATSGEAGVACAGQVGETCAITGGTAGTWTKTGSGTLRLTATGPAGTAPGGLPRVFVPTTRGVESASCAPLPTLPPFTTTCTGTTVGDVLQRAIITVRFPLVGGGTADVTGVLMGPAATGPGAGPLVVGMPAPPLLPPPPPVPPLSAPLLPAPLVPLAPPFAPSAGAPRPEVPIIPEADSAALVLAGILALAATRCWRRH